MKKFSSLIALGVLTIGIFLPKIAASQSPDKMSYQAVVRNSSDNVISNAPVGMQVSIVQGSPDGTVVYTETHTPETNANGLISIQIGGGPGFSDIDWGDGLYFVKTETDPSGGINYSITSTSQLMSVPYALYAQTSGNSGATQINDLSDAKSDDDGTDNGSSIYIGVNAGLTDSDSNLKNVGIGFEVLKNNTSVGNSAFGYYALYSNTTGFSNTAIGFEALKTNVSGFHNTGSGYKALDFNTTGNLNTACGSFALKFNETGSENTATGFEALLFNTQSGNSAMGFKSLRSNTIGVGNVAFGSESLYSNVNGNSNTGIGSDALYDNVDGNWNTAVGASSLANNTEGDMNTALGVSALFSNTTGNENTAVGRTALYSNLTGHENTAVGKSTLYYNTTGYANTATGRSALQDNTSGNSNTAMGFEALKDNIDGDSNTAIGYKALESNSSGNSNTAVGRGALFTTSSGTNNIGVGFLAFVPNGSGDNQVRIGNSFIAYAGIQVGWSVTSDKRWKENIRDLPYGLSLVKQLKPVDYVRNNNESQTREMGFIAQDVEELLVEIGYADQGFLTKDDNGFISLRYNDFIALLTKAIQEQQEIIENQNSDIESLTKAQKNTAERLSEIEALLDNAL